VCTLTTIKKKIWVEEDLARPQEQKKEQVHQEGGGGVRGAGSVEKTKPLKNSGKREEEKRKQLRAKRRYLSNRVGAEGDGKAT